MIHIVIECEYDTPFDKKTWFETDQRLLPCLESYGAKWLRSQISIDGKHTLCEFEAPDAEAVRAAYRKSGVAFKRAWIAEVIDPSHDLKAWVEKPHPGVTGGLLSESSA
jgi:hypothetical protein